MKLIGSLASPYVRKVRVLLEEKKIDCEWISEDVWATDTRIAQYNPLGQVPCLITDTQDTLVDSRVIVEYLDALQPEPRLIPDSALACARVKTWEALAAGATDAAVLARLEMNWGQRAPEQRSAAWVERQFNKVDQTLRFMNESLDGKTYCCEDHLTLADIALGCTLGWLLFRFPERDWRPQYPHLHRHHEHMLQLPSFASTQPK